MKAREMASTGTQNKTRHFIKFAMLPCQYTSFFRCTLYAKTEFITSGKMFMFVGVLDQLLLDIKLTKTSQHESLRCYLLMQSLEIADYVRVKTYTFNI